MNIDVVNLIKISVIMPVFNSADTLEEAVLSFERQSIREKELICVDDGSSDGSPEILKKLKKKYNNIKLLCQEHKGAGAARNLGLDKAVGEFVGFLDADDQYINEEALEIIYDRAIRENLSASAGLMVMFSNGHATEEKPLKKLLKGQEYRIVDFREYQDDYYYYCFLFRRLMLIENDIKFPNYLRYQDPPFLVRALYEADRFVLSGIDFYHYNYIDKRHLFTEKQRTDLLSGIMDVLEFSDNRNLSLLARRMLYRINYEYFYSLVSGLGDDRSGYIDMLKCAEQVAVRYDELIYPLLWYESGYDSKKLEKEFRESGLFVEIEKKACRYKVGKHIPQGSKVVVYGAGKYGRIVHDTAVDEHLFDCVGWVDKNKAGDSIDGFMISGFEDIFQTGCEYIYIAIADEQVCLDIKKSFMELYGFDPEHVYGWGLGGLR